VAVLITVETTSSFFFVPRGWICASGWLCLPSRWWESSAVARSTRSALSILALGLLPTIVAATIPFADLASAFASPLAQGHEDILLGGRRLTCPFIELVVFLRFLGTVIVVVR
jgi:hypothetical protein